MTEQLSGESFSHPQVVLENLKKDTKAKNDNKHLCWSDARRIEKEFLTPLTREHIFTSNNLFHCNKQKKNQTRNVYKLGSNKRNLFC